MMRSPSRASPQRGPAAAALAAESPLVVETTQLHRMLGGPELFVVDVAAPEVYEQGHLPGALRLDYSALVGGIEPAPGLPPAAERLSEVCAELGLGPQSRVVAYDHERGGRACRLLWTLHAVGHRRASVLNGGWVAWVADGLPFDTGPVSGITRSRLPVGAPLEHHADIDYVRSRLGDPGVVFLDVRSPAEFDGSDRRAARGGHIPGAVNLHWEETMDPARQHRLRDDQSLRALLGARGVVPEKEIVVYCQTHHRSAHTFAALKHLGFPRVRGYAGSWSEWGNRDDVPVAT